MSGEVSSGTATTTTSTTLETAASIDTFWLIFCAALVFFMQAGFALLEAGSVRSKNAKNILLKNLLDACLGAVIWWGFGYGIAYSGDNAFIGYVKDGADDHFFSKGWFGGAEHATGYTAALWFFQYVFAAAACTIVSGAVAERAQLGAYLLYTTIITALIYPVVVHWVWGASGWLSVFNTYTGDKAPFYGGCIDFAGSGVVHMTGGVAAFVGAAMIGPRKGRFDEFKKPVPMPGHSATLQVLGTFILWLGWYGFNPGSTLGINQAYGQMAARACVTTTMSAAGGGLTNLLLDKLMGSKSWDVVAVCNGILAGLVSITAGAATMLVYHAFIAGILGGFVYFGASKLLLYVFKIDDPLDAFAVHGACGFWGVLVNGLLAHPHYAAGFYSWSSHDDFKDAHPFGGAFYGKKNLFVANLVALLAEIAWVGVLAAILFGILKVVGVLRVSAEVEDAGMDVSKHGGTAYNSA